MLRPEAALVITEGEEISTFEETIRSTTERSSDGSRLTGTKKTGDADFECLIPEVHVGF
jgi:hypothetical protein